MKALLAMLVAAVLSTRVKNRSEGETCEFCLDEGQVVVSTRPAGTGVNRGKVVRSDNPVEEMGPCPHCERGLALEFPEQGRGHWGAQGYWRGRDTSEIRTAPKNIPLPIEENARRMRELTARLPSVLKEMPE